MTIAEMLDKGTLEKLDLIKKAPKPKPRVFVIKAVPLPIRSDRYAHRQFLSRWQSDFWRSQSSSSSERTSTRRATRPTNSSRPSTGIRMTELSLLLRRAICFLAAVAVLAALFESRKPEFVFFTASPLANEVATRLAGRLNRGPPAD